MKISKKSKNQVMIFITNTLSYDVIYVDGYHKADQVYRDCVNSWKNLNEWNYDLR